MNHGFSEILRGIGGGYEINRVVGAIGGLVYIIGVQAFTAWHIAEGNTFDITAYCLAFSGGLATIISGTAAAVAIKDRNVASSKVIEATGSKPATPPAIAPRAQPEIAEATDEADETDERPDYAR